MRCVVGAGRGLPRGAADVTDPADPPPLIHLMTLFLLMGVKVYKAHGDHSEDYGGKAKIAVVLEKETGGGSGMA